jgi:hypothetical protein
MTGIQRREEISIAKALERTVDDLRALTAGKQDTPDAPQGGQCLSRPAWRG